MTTGPKNHIVCVHCRASVLGTPAQARRHGWSLWLGGGVCGPCKTSEIDDEQLDADRPARALTLEEVEP